MQVLMKIAEKQRKTRAGFIQLMNYISRDSFKTFGIGINDDKDIAIRQCLINKDLHKKNRDGKDRFTYHEIFSFGVDVGVEKVIDIMLEFCEENFYSKDFNSFFAVHTDTNNIHCHVVADNVNFETGNLIHSVTEKQFNSMSEKKKEKNETFVYEHQRKLFEDICIKHGLDISLEERYEYMHEQKKNEGRKWLSKEQYRAKQDKDSWMNEIKDKLEEIYKNEDVNEDNIKDIAGKYGLEVTRHNRDKKYITFALLDTEGKRTNQKLKLVQELNKKKRKTQDEVTEDNVKLAVKLNTLETQEKELKKDSSENVFNYDNFFGGKKKEIEKEETREDIYAFFEKEKEKLRIRKEKEAEAKAKEDEEKKSKPVKEDIKTPVNTYIVEDSKPMNFELEKEYKTEKDILDNFYKTQEENKKEQDSKAKKLEQEIKDIEKAEIEKITKSDEVLRRLNIEEQERQAESKAKQEQEKKKDNRPVIFDRLKEFKEITSELELLEFQRDHRLTYSSEDIEKDFKNDVYLAFHSLISRKVEFNNKKEADRANDIMENVKNNNDSENIRKNLDLLDELIKDNEKEYERLKKNNWREEEETETTKTNDEEKEISVAEIVESKQELTSSEPVITNSKPLITDSEPIITNSVTDSDSTITNSKQEEQEEKQDLESKQVDLDSIMDKIDYYELAEKYNLYDTLPAFQIFTDELIYDSETGEGNFELAKSLIIDEKGEEYWRNMNPKDIKQWEETGLFTVAYTDINDDIREYRGYDYYSKDTIKQFLKENTTIAEELAKQYMPNDSKKKEQDSKSYEDKEKDREIDFN
jgi:possible relaxase